MEHVALISYKYFLQAIFYREQKCTADINKVAKDINVRNYKRYLFCHATYRISAFLEHYSNPNCSARIAAKFGAKMRLGKYCVHN